MIDDWIARESVGFALESPDGFRAAVDNVVGSLGGGVEVLGFGEALHGGEEILVLRNRLFRYLVEAHGYSAIAVESSFPKSHWVNEYVEGRGSAEYGDIEERGFSHRFGKLEANRELVEWMREYNSDPGHDVKVRFYGFDTPTEMMGSDSPRVMLQFVLDYLDSVSWAGEKGGRVKRERIGDLLGEDAGWENPAAMMDPSQSVGLSEKATELRLETEELIAALKVRRPELVAKGGKERFVEALHYAEMARQLLNYHAEVARASGDRVAWLLGMRDAAMADNLLYMTGRERGRGKVFVFAHNSHLKRGRAEWQFGGELLTWWPAGAHLAAMLGRGYAAIGTGVVESAENGIGLPEAGTLEARLAGGGRDVRFVPTHFGERLSKEIEALPNRSGSRRNPGYFPLTPESLRDFDWLAVLDSTGFSRGWPALPDV